VQKLWFFFFVLARFASRQGEFRVTLRNIAENMEWDKFLMAGKFLQRANALHPEDADSEALRQRTLALQNVYYDCYMSSFSREDLLKRLEQIIAGNIEMPEDENDLDEQMYRDAYVKEARRILASIEDGTFK
jgi:hypothetical protein